MADSCGRLIGWLPYFTEDWKNERRICLLLQKISRHVILLPYHLILSTWPLEYFVFVRLNFSFVSFRDRFCKKRPTYIHTEITNRIIYRGRVKKGNSF